ncbi:CD44 antigen isoform X3 [Pipra filicauda]|uniref:CD44 antigen n=1 Tax=Pipra filicauda TaxID=649802 RepID=A0A7R5KQ53_9PASS|nr:CD44 antigen isoform X3 [Pipra filicauda]
MANFSLWATFGLCLLKLCLAETQFNVSCRYGGVFHVEKNGRYSLTRPEAVKLCRALNSTLATLEQLKKAHELGFETCRYGFVVGHIVIPRIRPYHLCAANHTGIYKLPANTTGRYDAYCYNETETRDKGCEPVEKLDTSLLSNQDEIVIDNADGSRYNADGTRHTGGESSTSGADDENVGSGSTHETTPMDTSIRRSSPSYYGSATPVSQLPDHTSGGGEKGTPGKDYDDEVPSLSPDISFGTVTDDFHEEDGGHYHATTTVDSQHETLLEISTQDHWNPTFTDEEEQYPSSPSRALVTSENENQGPTQLPLPYTIHSGGISQEQNPANTTASIEQHEFTVAGENYFEKESSHTAMVSTHGAKQNDSMQDPWIYPGWDNGEEYATWPAITDRTIPSRGNNHEKDSSTTVTESVEDVNEEKATKEPLAPGTPPGRESEQANITDGSHVGWIPAILPDAEDHLNRLQTPLTTTVASPDGAHHKDPTQPPLPSDNEPGQGTEGIRIPTDTPRDEVLHKTTATIITTVTASTDVLVPEDITQEAWATHIMVTAAASPDGAHHKDPTQPPLPSDNEPGQGTEGIRNPTDTPRDEVLHKTTASIIKAVTESVEDVNEEKATKEPLAPGTPPGRESEQANITDGSHVGWIPAILPDAEDHLNRLQTPLTTSSTSSIYGNEGPRKGHYESTTFPEETATTKIDSQPRSARVPEWLIIVAALVALVLILAVCIAVNSRRRCGQKKKLVINNGKGAVEDRKSSALNGDISKSQEMVHLVHKERSNDRTQACDELLTVNETQNHHDLDMKTGV